MEIPTAAVPITGSSDGPGLRRRADELGELACSIERLLVMTLLEPQRTAPASIDATTDRSGPGDRRQLCEALLQRNLHQLHRAADELRVTAMRFRERADELDAAVQATA